MAKLSANGTEIARYRKEKLGDDTVLESITELSVRSNGRVLRKHVAVIKDLFNGSGKRRVDYGWKIWQRYTPTAAGLEQLDKTYSSFGYAKVDTRN